MLQGSILLTDFIQQIQPQLTSLWWKSIVAVVISGYSWFDPRYD